MYFPKEYCKYAIILGQNFFDPMATQPKLSQTERTWLVHLPSFCELVSPLGSTPAEQSIFYMCDPEQLYLNIAFGPWVCSEVTDKLSCTFHYEHSHCSEKGTDCVNQPYSNVAMQYPKSIEVEGVQIWSYRHN